MKNRAILLISFLLLLNLIRCGCPEPSVFYYNWTGCEITYEHYVKHDDGTWTGAPTNQTSFQGPSFGLAIKLNMEVVSQSETRLDFSNSALATSPCDPDTYSPKNKITNFTIYTLKDFDDGHLKDSDVTEYFLPAGYPEVFVLAYLNDSEFGLYKNLEYRLHETPTKGTVQKFKIEFVLENGNKVSIVTKEVTLIAEK